LKPHTPPDVKYSICHGFFNWLEKGRPHEFQQPKRNSNPAVTSVSAIQQTIGWDHFTRGRMAIEWDNLINSHIATKPHIKINAEDWGTKLFKIHWKYILELWDIRNSEVKGASPEEQNINLRQDMIQEITYLQKQNPDRPLIYISLSTPIRKPWKP
jgi:hypothetical protein